LHEPPQRRPLLHVVLATLSAVLGNGEAELDKPGAAPEFFATAVFAGTAPPETAPYRVSNSRARTTTFTSRKTGGIKRPRLRSIEAIQFDRAETRAAFSRTGKAASNVPRVVNVEKGQFHGSRRVDTTESPVEGPEFDSQIK
jgi:hypothetical protein